MDTLSIEANEWHAQADYPFHDEIYGFAMITVSDKFMLFGGLSNHYEGEVTVATFDLATLSWSRSGELINSRHGHGVIQATDGSFIVVGGVTGITERCTVNGDDEQLTCVEHGTDFGAETYFYYPELFTVDSNYCQISL